MATDTHDAIVQTEPPHMQPRLLGLDSEGWVYVGVTLFLLFAIFWLKAPKLIAGALDRKIDLTKRALDEARALREEAEALLADAKKRAAAAHKDAESILDHAKVEAGQIVDKAHRDADLLIQRRAKMAEDKIAAAERSAIADVRAKAAGAAAAAAAKLIADRHDAVADRALIERTIASIA